ncbi:MAG TPA: peptide-methionine (S)-S-oxide reductase [Candidatus Magasanikbacteria bacterium]|nr:MAG: peptide-methionine (S)-S-oxide reductase [Candidatus Magasanikbacteria bacterium RIFOXYC2_FULL_39_8]HAT03177.1 peptide-methionine (S)-S-oxide reductase [Candidatus Magasanikbacteria bacterium]
MTKTIILGGGCFWCTEATFLRMPGVLSVVPGYAGGTTKNPTYKAVCTGSTGHAEVIRVVYNEEKTSLEKILDLFFVVHDPTTLNRQGHDVGTQYRSAIYYVEDGHKTTIENYIRNKQLEYSKPIVTEIKSLETFYEAEEYHHNYFAKNPEATYCQAVIAPKIKKVEEELKIYNHET